MNTSFVTKSELVEEVELLKSLNNKLVLAIQDLSKIKDQRFETTSFRSREDFIETFLDMKDWKFLLIIDNRRSFLHEMFLVNDGPDLAST